MTADHPPPMQTNETTPDPPLLSSLSRLERPLQEAIYLSRPHRFVLRAYMEDEEVEVHLGDPGRLQHLLSPGAKLMLDGPFEGRKTRYSAILVQATSGTWVSLVSQLPNKLFPPLLERGHLPALWHPKEPSPTLRKEVKHGQSRFDFLLTPPHSQPCFVETKSVSWAEGTLGLFPDAPTSRGAKHLRELIALCASGHPAAVVFIAQRDDIHCIKAASQIDPDFANLLSQAHDTGVQILGVSVKVTPDGAWYSHPLPVTLHSKTLRTAPPLQGH